MDFSCFDEEHDPTLPLNEASVLPPTLLSQQGPDDVWGQYRFYYDK
jgi:hypothetical protein